MPAYVVTRPFSDSNVGSNLSSLAGAVHVAHALGRDLIIDWRGLRQLRDPSLNYFTEFLTAPPGFAGVAAEYAPADVGDYARNSTQARWLEPAEARAAASGSPGELPHFVVLERYHGLDRVHPGPESARSRILRRVYREVAPTTRIAAAADSWWHENLEAAFVIGVNVRTGNGQYFGKGERYASRVDISLFEDQRRFLRLLERAVRGRLQAVPRPLREDFQVFYATDSAAMSDLLARLPNAVTRRRTFPPPGEGDLYAFGDSSYTDRDSIEDTLTDMFLLARCDALVYNSSLFNQYARVVTGYFGGNHVHFESLIWQKRVARVADAARRRLRSA